MCPNEGCDFRDRCEPQWKNDFPIPWERDHYVTRRELVKFLTLGSGLLGGANVTIALAGLKDRKVIRLERRVAAVADVPPGGSLLFRYPTEDHPCILVRHPQGGFAAYSQICTHLACAVVHRPAEGDLFCPCHHGVFSTQDGRPTAGPPTRRLPQVLLEERGPDLFAVGLEI